MDISNCDGLEFLKTLKNNSIDLILTDPPYIISKDSGMNKFTEQVKAIEEQGKNVKTEKKNGFLNAFSCIFHCFFKTLHEFLRVRAHFFII